MIRISMVIWLIVAGGVAAGLYQVKYEVQRLEEAVREVHQSIESDKRRLRVLEAEWSYLNRPSRLSRLAEAHLDMGPMQAKQITEVDALPPRIDRDKADIFAFRDWPEMDGVPVPQRKPWSLRPQLAGGAHTGGAHQFGQAR